MRIIQEHPEQIAKAKTTNPAPGQYWPEQKAWYSGIVCQPDGAAWHLLLPKGVKFNAKLLAWGSCGTNVKGASSIYDGLANTKAMLEAGSPAAIHAQSLGDGIYLPSRVEALLLVATLQHRFDKEYWHWTSTQYSEDYSWDQHFSYGYQCNDDKTFERRCRFVRRLALHSFNPSAA